jgi:hypothetical protein
LVATVIVEQATGGSDGTPGAENTIATSTRLQTADQFDISDTTYPIPIPAAGFNYSYWITVYLEITGGTFTQINNVRFYSDGTINWDFGTGGELRRGNRDTGDQGFAMDSGYEVATGTQGTTGHTIEDGVDGHSFYNGQTTKTTDVEGDTVGSPATVDSGNHTIAEKCKAIVLQCKLDTAGNGAIQGEQTDETLTFKYDEI